MTKFRWEIIIEGSVDGKEWKEYTFKYKPSALNKRPPFVPFQSVSTCDTRVEATRLRLQRLCDVRIETH